jgi:hypothetical protein
MNNDSNKTKDVINISLSQKDINTIQWALKVVANHMIDGIYMYQVLPDILTEKAIQKIKQEFDYIALLANDIRAQQMGIKTR